MVLECNLEITPGGVFVPTGYGTVTEGQRMAVNDLGAILKRIDRRLEAVKLTDRAASLAAGMSADAIRTMRRQWENYKKNLPGPKQKTATAHTLSKLARPLQTTSEWLMSEIGPEDAGDAKERVRAAREARVNHRAKRVKGVATVATVVPIIGAVAGGTWREIDGADNNFDNEIQIEVPAIPGFPITQQRAFVVRSNMINRTANRGDFLIVLLGAQPRNGDLVIVARKKDKLYEMSAKRYIIAPNGKSVELRYDSLDPKLGNDIAMTLSLSADGDIGSKADDGSEIEITGIVLGVYRLP